MALVHLASLELLALYVFRSLNLFLLFHRIELHTGLSGTPNLACLLLPGIYVFSHHISISHLAVFLVLLLFLNLHALHFARDLISQTLRELFQLIMLTVLHVLLVLFTDCESCVDA